MNPDASSPDQVPGRAPTDDDLLSCLLDHIPDRIYFKDKAGRFLRVSRAEAQYLGAASSQEVIGKSDFDFFAAELAQAAYDDEQRLMRTREAIRGKVERKELLDGRTGWALVAKIPLENSAGELIGTCGISKDITELKNTGEALEAEKARVEKALMDLNAAHEELKAAQQRLIDFEKIQTIARLAYGVAHEIRNPLGILEMGIAFLTNQPGEIPAENVKAILGEMSKAIQRADVVISALMDGAASSGVNVKSTEVPQIVEDAVTMMKQSQEAGEEAQG